MHHQQGNNINYSPLTKLDEELKKKKVVHSLPCMISLGHSSEDAKMVATGLGDWSLLILFCRM